MNTRQRYYLKKTDRLKSRKLIDKLFTKGKSFSVFPFKIIWLPGSENGALQAGSGVSSRNFKKAVERNRIKRLMREAYRLQKNELQQVLLAQNKTLSVFILYIGRELPEYELVFDKYNNILRRLIKLADENIEQGT